jgi:hypothetical protein
MCVLLVVARFICSTKQFDSDEDVTKREEEQRRKREKEQAWQQAMRDNLKKEKEKSQREEERQSSPNRGVSLSIRKPPPAVNYSVVARREGSEEGEEEEGDEEDQTEGAGLELERREPTEDEVGSMGGGQKSTMLRRSGELKPGQVLPFAVPQMSPKREMVVSQHSIEFPL